MDRDFENRLVSYLRETFPNKTSAMPPAELCACVRTCMKDARNFGFVTERQFAVYTDLTFSVGKPLQQTHWGATVLENRTLDPETKCLRLQVQAKLSKGGRKEK